jgi:3'-5' exoribonuclease
VAKDKPPILPLHQVVAGQSAIFFALLIDKKRNKTRDGKSFFTLTFKDTKRTVTAAIWEDGELYAQCDKDWNIGGYYRIQARYFVHDRYGDQIDIQLIRPTNENDQAEGFKESDFAVRSRFDSATMFVELRALAEAEIKDEPLKKLTLKILDDYALSLDPLPATANKFFPFPGGWLEHTLSVTKNCIWLVERYAAYYAELKPPLNRDLVIAGAVLHDIGRVLEYHPPAIPGLAPEVSLDGRLFGHLALGRDLIRNAAVTIPEMNPELLRLLEHLVIAHLALPEWGSMRLPAIPEALILHHADDLDAKLEMYVRCLMNDKADGVLTDPDSVLRRSLWKVRTV